MEKDPDKRITLSELKEHPFFSGINWDDMLNKKITPPFGTKDMESVAKSYLEAKLAEVNLIETI